MPYTIHPRVRLFVCDAGSINCDMEVPADDPHMFDEVVTFPTDPTEPREVSGVLQGDFAEGLVLVLAVWHHRVALIGFIVGR